MNAYRPNVTLGPNGRVALQLAQAGLFVFPVGNNPTHPAHKTPLVKWRNESSNDAEQIVRQWWGTEKYRAAMVGIDLAKSGLIVADGDRHRDGQDGPAAIEHLLNRPVAEVGCPAVLTPNNGIHAFFKQPADREPLGNGTGRLPSGVDIRGYGGYVVSVGSIVADGGGRYLPMPGTPDLLIAFRENAIPLLPEPIIAEILAKKPDSATADDAPLATPKQPKPIGERERVWAAKALENELARLGDTPEGARNDAANAKAFALGRLVARGWLDEATVLSALKRAVSGWPNQRKTFDTIKRGLRAGMEDPHSDLPDKGFAAESPFVTEEDIAALTGCIIDEETGEIISDSEKDKREEVCGAPDCGDDTDNLPTDLTQPAGILGEIVDWIEASAPLPNRVLSLGAAIVTLGTIIGRRVAGPTKSGTHLYVVSLAPSGSGKDHAPRRATDILNAISADLVGPSEFMSQSAVMRHMRARPLSLCAIDEFGAFLARVTNQRASNHEKLISKQLREYWGASFETVRPAMWASDLNDMDPIFWPSLSILGSGVHEEFFASLSSKEAANGFLNRFLMLSSTAPVEIVDDPAVDKREIPPDIINALKALFDTCRGSFFLMGNSEAARQETPEHPLYDGHGMIIIPWGNDLTRDFYRALRRHALKHQQKTGTELWARTAEIAVRLATIHAVSRTGLTDETCIEEADWYWGERLALWSATTMERETEARIADTEAQARAKFVLLTIKKAGGRLTQRDLNRKLQHRYRSADLKDSLDALAASGAIAVAKATPKNGGPPTFLYSTPKKRDEQ